MPPSELRKLADLGDGLEVWRCPINKLKEQDVNAQIMQPREFERLVENIRERGRPESMPYCYWPADLSAPPEIVSGHHRTRATRAAGFVEIDVIMDRREMSRSQIAAKQIAHNALVGISDEQVLAQLVQMITDADDLLTTGLDEDKLPTLKPDPIVLATPSAEFEWRNVSFTFLPHQLDEFKEVVEALDGPQEYVGVADKAVYQGFVQACANYGRVRDIKSIGEIVYTISKLATAEVERLEEHASDDTWTLVADVLGSMRMPTSAGAVVTQALESLVKDGSATNRWHALEMICADFLAGPR
jgi:hypothetical protein